MKKKTFRVIALLLAVLTGVAVCQFAFAVEIDSPQAGVLDSEMGADSTAPDGTGAEAGTAADYYSRNADMNEDWVLNSTDARVILRLAVGLDWVRDPDWLPKGTVFGDIDDNGVVNTSDARSALRVGLKLNTIDEILQIAATETRPTAPSTEPTETEPTEATEPTEPEPTRNPDAVQGMVCEPYALELKAGSASYVMASDGRNCFVRVPELLNGLGVYAAEDGALYLVDSEGEYAAFTGDLLDKLGVTPQAVRDFVASYCLPEFGYFDGYTVREEIIDSIPFTVAEKDGVSFYYYADGSFLKIVGDDWSGAEKEYTTITVPENLTDYTELSNLGDEVDTNLFILKHGVDILF